MERDRDNVWKEGLSAIEEIDRKIEALEEARKKKVEELKNELGECYLREKVAKMGDRYLCFL